MLVHRSRVASVRIQEATLQNLAMTTWSIATLGSPTPALLALMPKVAAEAALRLATGIQLAWKSGFPADRPSWWMGV